jgi:Protein of unknown function (DUF2934)
MSQASHHRATATSLQRTTQSADISKVGRTSPSARDVPSQEQIAKLAYELWKERGRPEGCPDENWFRAEQQLLG